MKPPSCDYRGNDVRYTNIPAIDWEVIQRRFGLRGIVSVCHRHIDGDDVWDVRLRPIKELQAEFAADWNEFMGQTVERCFE